MVLEWVGEGCRMCGGGFVGDHGGLLGIIGELVPVAWFIQIVGVIGSRRRGAGCSSSIVSHGRISHGCYREEGG